MMEEREVGVFILHLPPGSGLDSAQTLSISPSAMATTLSSILLSPLLRAFRIMVSHLHWMLRALPFLVASLNVDHSFVSSPFNPYR